MHHLCGMDAPFQRWLCTTGCGFTAPLGRNIHLRRHDIINLLGEMSLNSPRMEMQLCEYFVSVRHPRPQEVRHPHRENPTSIPHRWCMAAARIAHGRHAVGSFRNCVQPSHGLAFNGQYMRVVNDTVADGIGHGRIIKQLMPAGDVELRTEDSGCHLTPGFN